MLGGHPNAGLVGTLTVTPPAAVPVTSAPSSAVPITLTAKNIAFYTNRITVPAGSTVLMTFVNNDAGVPHNFALYTDKNATTKIFGGEIMTGVGTIQYTFVAPSTPGEYFFRCDVHPETMTGTFVVT